jgi:hypothetical protein
MILNGDELRGYLRPYWLKDIEGVASQGAARQGAGANQITFQGAAPAAGTWLQGDVCWNSGAAVGQPKGWQCTVSGTPGTWVSMGNL